MVPGNRWVYILLPEHAVDFSPVLHTLLTYRVVRRGRDLNPRGSLEPSAQEAGALTKLDYPGVVLIG